MKYINLIVPELPESVNDAIVVKWHKKIGDPVYQDENIVDIETDKIMIEISSPCDGILHKIIENRENRVKSQQVLGHISKLENHQLHVLNNENKPNKNLFTIDSKKNMYTYFTDNKVPHQTPSMRRLIKLKNNTPLTTSIKSNQSNLINSTNTDASKKDTVCFEKRVKMTSLRKTISKRLLESQKNAVMLTTFNEVNMQPIICLRKKYGALFEKKHGVRLGYMSFYVKAVVEALKKFPTINAYIDGDDIVYYKNFDISIAVSTKRGLITPVLRNAESMTFSEIEKKIKKFAHQGSENKIQIKDLIGGNFTITNGGVFGSLMSTPIINPPQTAILGMHVIQKRPVVINDKIEILPMMYLALSYDHRLIDGKESVGFLLKIKNILEDFVIIFLDI